MDVLVHFITRQKRQMATARLRTDDDDDNADQQGSEGCGSVLTRRTGNKGSAPGPPHPIWRWCLHGRPQIRLPVGIYGRGVAGDGGAFCGSSGPRGPQSPRLGLLPPDGFRSISSLSFRILPLALRFLIWVWKSSAELEPLLFPERLIGECTSGYGCWNCVVPGPGDGVLVETGAYESNRPVRGGGGIMTPWSDS